MKKILSLFLALALIFCLVPAAFAADADALAAADTLHALGLFNGIGDGPDGKPIYDLDRAPTRSEAVAMLVRLLGKDAEAKAGTWETPFTDVEGWPVPYVGYAYANGLTKGTSATTFGGDELVSATQYLTFVLRALGYDSSSDFAWNEAWKLSDEIGLTHGEYSEENNYDFLRADVAEVSAGALPVSMNGTETTLAEALIEEGVFTEEQYLEATGDEPGGDIQEQEQKTDRILEGLKRVPLPDTSSFVSVELTRVASSSHKIYIPTLLELFPTAVSIAHGYGSSYFKNFLPADLKYLNPAFALYSAVYNLHFETGYGYENRLINSLSLSDPSFTFQTDSWVNTYYYIFDAEGNALGFFRGQDVDESDCIPVYRYEVGCSEILQEISETISRAVSECSKNTAHAELIDSIVDPNGNVSKKYAVYLNGEPLSSLNEKYQLKGVWTTQDSAKRFGSSAESWSKYVKSLFFHVLWTQNTFDERWVATEISTGFADPEDAVYIRMLIDSDENIVAFCVINYEPAYQVS